MTIVLVFACVLLAARRDPVFAAAIVGRDEIPHKLRNLLNVDVPAALMPIR